MTDAISDYKGSAEYKTAIDADLYYRHLNPTIMRVQKWIYNHLGKKVPDIYSANNKIPSRLYFYFITQAVQYLLGNGVSFGSDETKEKLGDNFDYIMQEAAKNAQNGGVAYIFWNLDHVETFSAMEFVPLYDEESGYLKAGIRWWQLTPEKPLRMTLYELNGYTEYMQKKGEPITVLQEKKTYIQKVESSEVGGTVISDGGNYADFPIVPLYNINKQSELVGGRETLDAYDLMASALINNIDDANIIYWVIKNAGGMTDEDDQRFIQRLKTMHVAHTEGDEQVDPHSVTVPYEASESALETLRDQLFTDFMALDVKKITGGAATATQIRAAYEPLNSKTDMFEANVTKAILSVLNLAGIEDEPTYTRSKIVNASEDIQTIVNAETILPKEYAVKKILEILGDIDRVDDVMRMIDDEEIDRTPLKVTTTTTEETEETEE